MSEPARCLACGTTLPRRATGRPATYCSTAHRQAVHRARKRAQAAAERAAILRASARNKAKTLNELLAGELQAILEEPIRCAEPITVASARTGRHGRTTSCRSRRLPALSRATGPVRRRHGTPEYPASHKVGGSP